MTEDIRKPSYQAKIRAHHATRNENMNTIKGSELPLVCPICGAGVVDHNKSTDEDEGVIYDCGLDFYVNSSGFFTLEEPCVATTNKWITKQNHDNRMRRSEDKT